jgi:hypothetical protein
MQIHAIRKILSITAILAVAAGASGCAGDPIRSDYDPTADFSQYNTYNFFADAGPEETNYQSFFSQYLVAAISREMEMRGYTKSDDPDLLVNFNAILQEKTDVRTTPAPHKRRFNTPHSRSTTATLGGARARPSSSPSKRKWAAPGW